MTFTESTQYVLKEATIETTGGPISIINLIEEIKLSNNLLCDSYVDNIHQPFVTYFS